WILQQLLHPVITVTGLHLYHFFQIGKILLYVSQKLGLLSFPVYAIEKNALRPPWFPASFPNALAKLAYAQLAQLDRFNLQRKKITKLYMQITKREGLTVPSQIAGAVYLRFNIFSKQADEIRFRAKQKGIILGNWFSNVIDPRGVDYSKIGYTMGSCPESEKAAKYSINLPTYPYMIMSDANKVINLF
ncbi:MAG: DegT/DnrJ/EryC1/StrS family aminotransferase, partial [Patescibacteria group bacterium]